MWIFQFQHSCLVFIQRNGRGQTKKQVKITDLEEWKRWRWLERRSGIAVLTESKTLHVYSYLTCSLPFFYWFSESVSFNYLNTINVLVFRIYTFLWTGAFHFRFFSSSLQTYFSGLQPVSSHAPTEIRYFLALIFLPFFSVLFQCSLRANDFALENRG